MAVVQVAAQVVAMIQQLVPHFGKNAPSLWHSRPRPIFPAQDQMDLYRPPELGRRDRPYQLENS
jgi:hypothetical protein